MEALSHGAAEAGGHVIGVTCDQIEAWRPVKANPWVGEDWHYATLQQRVFALIENCDAALALPGGIGTLAEIMLTWNLLLTHVLPPRPLILIGPGWQATIDGFLEAQGGFRFHPMQTQPFGDCMKSYPMVNYNIEETI